MYNNRVLDDYFDWLYSKVKRERPSRRGSYKKLLMTLHDLEFTYIHEYDFNRAADGVDLRWRYVNEGGDRNILRWKEPCTVFEMILALAYRVYNVVDDPELDGTIGNWFWLMLSNIDLHRMTDAKYNLDEILYKVDIFLNRRYSHDGVGNIITIKGCKEDLRDVEIWYQMCWYLDSIL